MTVSSKTEKCLWLAVWNKIHFTTVHSLADYILQLNQRGFGTWSERKWNEVKWSEVKWNEVKWSEVKWSEMKWSEVKWSEVAIFVLFPQLSCIFLGCKANARKKKTRKERGTARTLPHYLLFVLFGCYLWCYMYCLCVNVYCHLVITQLQLIILVEMCVLSLMYS